MLSYSVSQTKWRITTEAENSARGSAFVLLWRLSAADLQANLHNRTSFAQVGRLNISAITFESFSHFHKARLFRWTIFFSIWEKQTFLLSNFFATFKNSVLPKIRVVDYWCQNKFPRLPVRR